MPDTTPDTIIITCARPALNQTQTVTVPPEIVAVLQYLTDNVTVPDPATGQPVKKYKYAANVLWVYIFAVLLPMITAEYSNAMNAGMQAQMQAQDTAVRTQLQQAVAAITVQESQQ